MEGTSMGQKRSTRDTDKSARFKKQKIGDPRKVNWYKNARHQQQFLCTGQRGFLCTTNMNEKNAVKEAKNLLSEYGEDFEISTRSSSQPEEDISKDCHVVDVDKSSELNSKNAGIEDEMAEELLQLRSVDVVSKFYSVDTGVPNVVFVTTKVCDPVGLAAKILEDIGQKKTQKSRFLLRMLPIQTVCKATLEEMKIALARIYPADLKSGFNSFQIAYKARYNNTLSRMEVLRELADLVMKENSFNSVNLTDPKFTIIVEVLKGHCCMGVVTNYKRYKKFNLIEVASGFDGSK